MFFWRRCVANWVCVKLLACLVAFLSSGAVTVCRADTDGAIHPHQRVMVIVTQARVMAGDEQTGTVPQGTILTITRANGNWRYSPDCKGWVHLKETMPMDRVITEVGAKIQRKPTSELYQMRGIAWMAREEWGRAAQDFEEAYDLGESSTNLHYNLGICYDRMGESTAAIEEFDSILKTFPDEFPTLLARGNLLLQLNQTAAGLRDIERAIAIKPESDEAYNSRGIALRMFKRYDEAIVAYNKALEISPDRADSICNRGYARKQLGDLKGALTDYEAAYKLEPTSNSIRNDLAWLLATSSDEMIRNPERAVELSEAVCEATQRRDADYLDTLAAAYAATKRFAAAVETARLAVTLMEDEEGVAELRQRISLYEKEQPFIDSLKAGAEK